MKAVSERLGHASAALTLDVYGHVFPDKVESGHPRLTLDSGRQRPISVHSLCLLHDLAHDRIEVLRPHPPGP